MWPPSETRFSCFHHAAPCLCHVVFSSSAQSFNPRSLRFLLWIFGRGGGGVLCCFCALPFSSSCHKRVWKDFGVLFDAFAQLVGTCTVQTFPLATPHIIQLSHPEKGVFWFVVMVHFHPITSRCRVFFTYAVIGLGSTLCSAVLSSSPSYI